MVRAVAKARWVGSPTAMGHGGVSAAVRPGFGLRLSGVRLHDDQTKKNQAGRCPAYARSSQAKIAFFLFFRRNYFQYLSYDFVTPFSIFANNKRSYPTNSTTPDRLRDIKVSEQKAVKTFPVLAQHFFRRAYRYIEKVFKSDTPRTYPILIYI